MTENNKSGDFIERISIILVLGAFLGGFIVLLDVRFTVTIYGQVIQIGQGFAAEVKGMVLQSMLISGFAAVVGYWLDSTSQGKEQAKIMNKIAEAADQSQALAVAAARAPAPSKAAEPIGKDAVTPAPKNLETGNVPAAEVQPPKGAP